MESWKEFEKSCYNYLVRTYGGICKFEPLGESDSTYPDVRVRPNNGKPFYIETKESLAQCGQFVLFPDETRGVFEYSSGNKSPLNSYSQEIMNHMNRRFDDFANAGTRGQDINLPDSVFYGWIKKYYSDKGVRFFITKGSNYVILPIDRFEEYFSVSATYRIKKSGSADPSRTNVPEIISILNARGCRYELLMDGKKMFVKATDNLSGLKLRGVKYTYLFNQTERGVYNIRKLSNTQNANVIFSISLKRGQDIRDLQEFEKSIR